MLPGPYQMNVGGVWGLLRAFTGYLDTIDWAIKSRSKKLSEICFFLSLLTGCIMNLSSPKWAQMT